MARRRSNHWLDNTINQIIHRTLRIRIARTVREGNPPLVVGNGILDQINNPNNNSYDYIPWQEEEITAPM